MIAHPRLLYRLLCIAVACVAIARDAHAQSNLAARRVLLDQAEQANTAGDHARALDLAQRAASIELTPSVQMFIARQQAVLNRPAAAMSSADACVHAVQANPNVTNHDQILAQCRQMEQDLRSQVGLVTVQVPQPRPAGLQVTVNGETLLEALYDVPYVVDPGNALVVARVNDQEAFRQQVEVRAGQSVSVAVHVAQTTATSTTTSHSPAPTAATPSHGGSIPIGAVVLMGVGVLALIASAVTYVMRVNALGSCMVLSNEIACPTQAAANNASSAETFTLLADVTLGVGAAAVVGGALWFIFGRASHGEQPPHARSRITPFLGMSSVGIGGQF